MGNEQGGPAHVVVKTEMLWTLTISYCGKCSQGRMESLPVSLAKNRPGQCTHWSCSLHSRLARSSIPYNRPWQSGESWLDCRRMSNSWAAFQRAMCKIHQNTQLRSSSHVLLPHTEEPPRCRQRHPQQIAGMPNRNTSMCPWQSWRHEEIQGTRGLHMSPLLGPRLTKLRSIQTQKMILSIQLVQHFIHAHPCNKTALLPKHWTEVSCSTVLGQK